MKLDQLAEAQQHVTESLQLYRAMYSNGHANITSGEEQTVFCINNFFSVDIA